MPRNPVPIMDRSVCPLFLRIREGSKPLEPGLTDEFQQFLEIPLPLAWMADDHGGPQDHSGDPFTKFPHQFPGPGPVYVAAHHGKHLVGNMLERDVEILADLWITRHLHQDILREIGRIGIVYPDPLDTIDGRETTYQFSE